MKKLSKKKYEGKVFQAEGKSSIEDWDGSLVDSGKIMKASKAGMQWESKRVLGYEGKEVNG